MVINILVPFLSLERPLWKISPKYAERKIQIVAIQKDYLRALWELDINNLAY